MTAQRLHRWVEGLLHHRTDERAFAELLQFVRRCPFRGELDDDEAYDVVGHLLQQAHGHGLCDPDDLLRQARTLAHRRLDQRQRHERRTVAFDHGVDSALPDADLLDAEDRAERHEAVAPYLDALHALAADAIASYRADRREIAQHTWELWCWQRRSGSDFRSQHELVARAFHGTLHDTDPARWRRRRDRLMRRRSRLRQRMRDLLDERLRAGQGDAGTLRHQRDHVLPWLSNHSSERAP